MLANVLGLVLQGGIVVVVVKDMMQSLQTKHPAMWKWWRAPSPTLAFMDKHTEGFYADTAYTAVRLKTSVLAIALCSGYTMRLLDNTTDGDMVVRWATVVTSGTIAHAIIAATLASSATWWATLVTLIGPCMCVAVVSFARTVYVLVVLAICCMVVLCAVAPFVSQRLRVATGAIGSGDPKPAWVVADPSLVSGGKTDPDQSDNDAAAVHTGLGPEAVTETDFFVASAAYGMSALGPYVLMLAVSTSVSPHNHSHDAEGSGNTTLEFLQVLIAAALVTTFYTLDVTCTAVGMRMLDDAVTFLMRERQSVHEAPPVNTNDMEAYVKARTRWIISCVRFMKSTAQSTAAFDGRSKQRFSAMELRPQRRRTRRGARRRAPDPVISDNGDADACMSQFLPRPQGGAAGDVD